jgi:hypothetical protein
MIDRDFAIAGFHPEMETGLVFITERHTLGEDRPQPGDEQIPTKPARNKFAGRGVHLLKVLSLGSHAAK